MDLYDDVIATGTTNNSESAETKFENAESTNGTAAPPVSHNPSGRRLQLYVGNLTWVSTILF